jgi:hypothetical protein
MNRSKTRALQAFPVLTGDLARANVLSVFRNELPAVVELHDRPQIEGT